MEGLPPTKANAGEPYPSPERERPRMGEVDRDAGVCVLAGLWNVLTSCVRGF